MYLQDPSATGEPPRQLKGYAHVSLNPGASATVSLPIDARALSWWDTSTHRWTVTKGCDEVDIGSSERDIVARKVLAVNGATCPGASASVVVPGVG
jgi:beta-glucosidase